MVRFRKDFPEKLDRIDLDTLEQSPHSIYAVSPELELIYMNPAWFAFGKANGMQEESFSRFGLGGLLIDSISNEQVRAYYLDHYKQVLETQEKWDFEYECSSKEEYRVFHQRVLPLRNRYGLLIINTLMVSQAMNHMMRIPHENIEEMYTQPSGFITMCSNCRHTERKNQANVWDWVPAFVEKSPLNASHSICPICYEYYWKNSSVN